MITYERSKRNIQRGLIKVENIGKSYKVYESKTKAIKEVISLGRKKYYKENWVLRNVSTELRRGECLGIVGRNGSGKSTLLQIICGTIKPGQGRVKTFGRIGALLELGSGFNPEFTGRENIFINGIIHGLTTNEIRRKMKDIEEFAEIEEAIDQPIRTYSSGMVVKLAFAIIANIDADILIIDEALAVGDAQFTQKCMRYIRRVKMKMPLIC